MRAPAARRAGPILVVAGGLLLAAGAFLPQVIPTGLDRSHWSVIGDHWELLLDPHPFFPREYTVPYAESVLLGLLYPIAAGLVIATGGLLGRSRAAAAAALLFHIACFWLLAAGTLALAAMRVSADAEGDARNGMRLAGGAVLLTTLFFVEVALAYRAARATSRSRRPLIDAVNLPPAVFLLLLHLVLYLVFRKHPNWPSAGYAVSAGGAALAILGMELRRVHVPPPAPAR
jgi:hypothetical protein